MAMGGERDISRPLTQEYMPVLAAESDFCSNHHRTVHLSLLTTATTTSAMSSHEMQQRYRDLPDVPSASTTGSGPGSRHSPLPENLSAHRQSNPDLEDYFLNGAIPVRLYFYSIFNISCPTMVHRII